MNNLLCVLALALILISLIIIFSARNIVRSRSIECDENRVVSGLKIISTVVIAVSLVVIYYFK